MVDIVAGTQWGDEGKGKVVDYLATEADMVIRGQGGANAGHTVERDGRVFKLHAIPSGIFNPETTCIIGNGCVVNPVGVETEIRELQKVGINTSKLIISPLAHLVMPYHVLFDMLDEKRRMGNGKEIGSTHQGIAWCYADKANRSGFRVEEVLDLGQFSNHISQELEWINDRLSLYGHSGLSLSQIMDEIEGACRFIAPHVMNPIELIHTAVSGSKQILLEGQLGLMRDLNEGAYPFVTSSCPSPAGIIAGAGISPLEIIEIYGVMKAYTTAVGAGPFPTELRDQIGEQLRTSGNEYGATTGRKRRCGWLDIVALKYAMMVGGFTSLIMTKLDILSQLDEIKICIAYKYRDSILASYPTTDLLGKVEPEYETLPGWKEDITGATSMDELPEAARSYIDHIEQLLGVPIVIVTNGAHRDKIILRK
ncbi:MAG: adenylosuccinate synthase [Patescibacteria group bacterium]